MAESKHRRKIVSLVLGLCLLVLFAGLATLNAFNLKTLSPATTGEILVFTGLSTIAFLLFVAVLILLVRNVLKLYADQRNRVMGTRLRTRMLWGAVLVSLLPIAFMFAFSYDLMNRAVDRWFSQPVTQMRDDSNNMAQELARYMTANARAEADSIAAELPSAAGVEVEGPRGKVGVAVAKGALGRRSARRSKRPQTHSSESEIELRASDAKTLDSKAAMLRVLREHEITLQNGFAIVYREKKAIAAFQVPQRSEGTAEARAWLPDTDLDEDGNALQSSKRAQGALTGSTDGAILTAAQRTDLPVFSLGSTDYALGVAALKEGGTVVVGLPMPSGMGAAMSRLRVAANTYWVLFRERRQIRNLYMILLLMMTSLALFASSWLALHLSKQVTKPVEALADAMEAIAAGDYAHRVAESATEELGELVRSFNHMASDLENSRRAVEESTVQLSLVNRALEARRGELETMLETIPNGVATLSTDRKIVLTNRALGEMMDPGGERPFVGASISEVFPAELVEVLERLILRSHRMGSASSEVDLASSQKFGGTMNLLVTVAILESPGTHTHQGYVLVLENATELLRAQKQSAWKEVARRVAHEIKNPLTPISLSAEQTRRHVDRLGAVLEEKGIASPSIAVIRRCSEVTTSAVESLRSLVDQFASLAEFPTARPRPADLNTIVENALALFAGRLTNIRIMRRMGADLPLVIADPEALKRALGNLVDNAVEAMQKSLLRELRVETCLLESGMVELVVADTGSGLTDEMRERLFLPYFSTKQRGTGLGLAIAAKIIQEHQGTIRAEKNQPVGAKFIVELRPATMMETSGGSQATSLRDENEAEDSAREGGTVLAESKGMA